jgi:hypothetical protein
MFSTTRQLRFPAEGPLGRLSAVMCVVVALGGALAELSMAWVWLSPSLVQTFVVARLGLGAVPVKLDGATRLAGFAVSMIPMLVLFYMLDQAFRLFDAYRLGQVFSQDAPVRLRRIGLCMVLMGVLRPVTLAVLGLVLTYANPPGQIILALGFSVEDYMIAAFGGLILAIGHVMIEANRIAKEHREFV